MAGDGVVRRSVAVVAVLAVLLAITTYLIGTAQAYGQVVAVRAVALIGGWKSDPAAAAPAMALSDDTVRRAVAARPLDVRALNVAMFRAVVRGGDAAAARWIPVVSQLGWRDTPTLQNRLFVAATNNDLPGIMDLSDALMRRQQLQDQIIPILSIVEQEPAMRALFARRLLAAPPWRSAYLYAAGHLKDPEQLAARAALLVELRRGGLTLDRDALRSNIQAMVAGDSQSLAFALWSSSRAGVERPLFDPDFTATTRDFANGQIPVAFEWALESGNGFSADSYIEGGRAAIDIRWNGRGVPVLIHQQTSATPGRYRLNVRVAPEKVRDLGSFAFRMVCDGNSYLMQPAPGNPATFETPIAVPCSFPTFEVRGDIAAEGTPRQIDLYGFRLVRIGGEPDMRG